MSNRLKIAIQKSGRLSQECQALIKQCGIKVHWHKERLIVYAKNMPIEILRVRDDDIPGLIFDDVVDLGIVGENILKEQSLSRRAIKAKSAYKDLCALNFGECRLSLAIPKEMAYTSLGDLQNKRIATSYPYLLEQYMNKAGVAFDSCLLTGSVEMAPNAGIAPVICDLVSSGATLEANGLKEVEVIHHFKARLIQKQGRIDTATQQLIDKLLARIQGIQKATESKYIMMHVPTDKLTAITSLLPGAENPTVLPLLGVDNKVAVHVVSQEVLFWETMEQLKLAGASSILILPIEKMLA